MKFSVLVFFTLILVACQKGEPEVVNVNKVIKCFGSKGALKQEACGELNDSEKQAIACLTTKESSDNCKSLYGMNFFMDIERDRGPAKQRGTHFKIPLGSGSSESKGN